MGWLGGECQLPLNHNDAKWLITHTHTHADTHTHFLDAVQSMGQDNPRGRLPRPLAHCLPFTERPKHSHTYTHITSTHTQQKEQAGTHTHTHTHIQAHDKVHLSCTQMKTHKQTHHRAEGQTQRG